MKQKFNFTVDDNGILFAKSNSTSNYLGVAYHPHVDCYVVRLDAYITSSVVKRQLSLYPIEFMLGEDDAAGIAALFFKSRYKPCSMPLTFLYKCKKGDVLEINLIENTIKRAAVTQSGRYETMFYDREKAESDVKWYNDWFDKNRVIGTKARTTKAKKQKSLYKRAGYPQELKEQITAALITQKNGKYPNVGRIAKRFGVSPSYAYKLKLEAMTRTTDNSYNPLEAAMCERTSDDAVDLITELKTENARLQKENESLIASLKIVSRRA